MKKKILLIVVFLLLCGTVLAQYAAPENLGVGFPCYMDTNEAFEIYLFWDRIDDPNLDYYEFNHDGVTFLDSSDVLTSLYGELVIEEWQDNDYHTTGVRIYYDDGGVSDYSWITYYYSGTAYYRPSNVKIENHPEEWHINVYFEEPLSGGENAPVPTEYIIYLNGEVVETTSDTGNHLISMIGRVDLNESYVVSIDVLYSDGYYSSDMRLPMLQKESYFGELDPAEDVAVDEETGILSWHVPGDGDVIGGTISNLSGHLGAHWDGWVWPTLDPFQFGDGINHVSTSWQSSGNIHDWGRRIPDMERVSLGKCGFVAPDDTEFSEIDVSVINQINNASSLEYEWNTAHKIWDADTSADGYGDFLVYRNIESGYYGVAQVIDVTDALLSPGGADGWQWFDMTWWFQTNGSDDFSSAQRYYPLYYNIYLDSVLVDSVRYEIVTNDKETFELIVIDSTLFPTGEFDYQFESLVDGESYTAEVEAVYYGLVGKAERQSVAFTYNGLSVGPHVEDINKGYSFPNPFSRSTTISFSIPHPSKVELDIYNLKGQKVKTLVRDELQGDTHEYIWDGTDESSNRVAPGVYFYKLQTDDFVAVDKMLMIK